MKDVLGTRLRVLVSVLTIGGLTAAAWALPPSPANDDPNNAAVISGPLPTIIYGTTVLADDSITTLPGLPAIDPYVDGPDVFYSFTPTVTATYRIQLAPWHHAPLRSSDRRFVIYVLDSTMTEVDGVRAPGSARPVNLDVALTMNETYLIGIDHDDATYDNFVFTLIVDELNLTNPDDCAAAETLSGPLPVLRLNNIDNAVHDYSFVQGTGRCGVSGTTPTTAPGNDHVYKFTAPASGDYALELISSGFDGVLYVNDSCPPVFPDGCLGASNHSTAGTSGAKHELVVVTLLAGADYYIYVDNGSTTYTTGPYALIIDDAIEYELSEIEPNGSAVNATPVGDPRDGGQLVGPADADYWAVTGLDGDRVYAWVNLGGSSNSTLDTWLSFLGTDGSTVIEFDDDDGDGISSPINDLHYVYSTSSSVIAGAKMIGAGTHYFVVEDNDVDDTKTVHRYRFHNGVIPATRNPLVGCELNDDMDSADYTGKHYYAGVIDRSDDSDFYAFDAVVGDRVFIAFDGDPERDSTGFDAANDDPNAFHGKLVIYDPDGDVLISDVSDSNTSEDPPDYPAQACFFIARTSGRYYIEVKPQSTASQVGPGETYELAVFIDNAAPALAEEMDPVVALTPDFNTDSIAGLVTDNQPGDTGVCTVELYAETNLMLVNLTGLGTGTATFDIVLTDPNQGGSGKIRVIDCTGNAACDLVMIDIDPPVCAGSAVAGRSVRTLDGPYFIPDNDAVTGIDVPLVIGDAGTITDVNLTATFETTSCADLDIRLTSPDLTEVEIQTDRGSSLAFNITDATWDDDADELMPLLSGDEPYTGTWLPEGTLADFNGGPANGTWILNVRDDYNTQNGGSRLVYAKLDVVATFAGPQTFAGLATDSGGFDAGIQSIVLTGAVNAQLNLPPGFTPGDTVVEYTVTLIDSTLNGSGTVTVTDMQDNTCQSIVNLTGFADGTGPANTGGVTTDLRFEQEIQADLPYGNPAGASSTITVAEPFLVGEVEAEITIDTLDVGRLAATINKSGEFASLINRVGMDDRASAGLTKNTLWITLDDDAPVADDAHEEPALGTIPFLGVHQPDGRGEFIGDGITTDKRDNMMFALANQSAAGPWKVNAADHRMIGTSRTELRRWALTLKSPCGPERYVGVAQELAPESGVQSIAPAAGATNLTVVASFTPGDEVVEYRVELTDPNFAGAGDIEIYDVAGNVTIVPVALAAISADRSPPIITGSYDPATAKFIGTATDNGPGDSGIVAVEVAPYGENIELVMVTPDPPAGAGSVDFIVGVALGINGRGYIRVTDACGWRSYILVEMDAEAPVCTGSINHSKRYISSDLPQPIPDNNVVGVSSSIVVADTDVIEDVNLTFNITHAYDDDIDLTLIAPRVINLLSDIGSTGNNFIDTTLDDEAAAPIPDSSSEAPFTGTYQPEDGPALFALDGLSADATYVLRVADDKDNDTGTFDSWSLTIESSTFPERYDGRVEEPIFRDTGVCAVELLPGASNLVLTVDPFTNGDTIVRYSVELTPGGAVGEGSVRVLDCVGNECVTPILLYRYEVGDLNCDGFVNNGDIDPFVTAITDPDGYVVQYPDCDLRLADMNGDSYVNNGDIDDFVSAISS